MQNIIYKYILQLLFQLLTFRGGKAGQPAPHWPAPHLARPAKLLRVRISDPPRIRAGLRVCGPARVSLFFLN